MVVVGGGGGGWWWWWVVVVVGGGGGGGWWLWWVVVVVGGSINVFDSRLHFLPAFESEIRVCRIKSLAGGLSQSWLYVDWAMP